MDVQQLQRRIGRMFTSAPDLFMLELDLDENYILLCEMDRDCLQRSVFLDDRVVKKSDELFKIPLLPVYNEFVNSKYPSTEHHYLFHSGHSCSTLLSNALGTLGNFMLLREPLPLYRVANAFRDSPSHATRKLLELCQCLYSRRFDSGEKALIKPNSGCLNLIVPLLSGAGTSRAVFIYSDLPSYLISILKEIHLYEAYRSLLDSCVADARRLGLPCPFDPQRLAPAEGAALMWLSKILTYEEAMKHSVGERVIALNTDTFLQDPARMTRAVAEFLSPGAGAGNGALASVFSKHAKHDDREYDGGVRDSEKIEFMNRYRDELDRAQGFLVEVLGGQSIPAPPLTGEIDIQGEPLV